MANKKTTQTRHFKCPFCDEEIFEMNLPYCTACHVELIICPECKKPVPRESKTCPGCGSKIEAKSKQA